MTKIEDFAHGSFLGSPARRREVVAGEEEHDQSINQSIKYMKGSTHVSKAPPTCTVAEPAAQVGGAGGGAGGKAPESPGNHVLDSSGSAERMVISGRLLHDIQSLQHYLPQSDPQFTPQKTTTS